MKRCGFERARPGTGAPGYPLGRGRGRGRGTVPPGGHESKTRSGRLRKQAGEIPRPGGVVSSLGLEPRTHALKGRCSTY
jgi:hypothetical protein